MTKTGFKKLKKIKVNGYLFSIFVTIVTSLLKASLVQSIQWPENSFILSTAAIIVVSWYGGLGPGILATIGNFLINDYFFISPGDIIIRNKFAENLRIALFLLEGVLISSLFESLHRSLAKARKVDELKSEFLSVAAHELRTPISVIKIISELLFKKLNKKHGFSKEAARQVKDIVGEVDRMESLVKDLLDTTRIENKTLALSRDYIRIDKLISSVIEKMENVTGRNNILYKSRVIARVFVDKRRIEQVLTNLIANAANNSPKQKVIEVKSIKDGRTIIVSVTDKGKGIGGKEQKMIFDKFYQVEDKQPKGFGLGLFISKQIVEMHNGKIWLDSKLGKGSTFYFSLPVRG